MESDKKPLQHQITVLSQQNKETQQRYDVLEQYGSRLCLRIHSVPKGNNEKAKDGLNYVKGLIEEVPDLEMPEVVIDKEHRIGPIYVLFFVFASFLSLKYFGHILLIYFLVLC